MKSAKVIPGLAFLTVIMSASIARAEGWQLPDNPGGLPEDFMVSVQSIADWMLGLATLAAVLAIVYGGLIYIASSGDEDRIRSAKKTIKYALMGLVMAGLAYAIVTVVIDEIITENGGQENGQNQENSGEAM